MITRSLATNAPASSTDRGALRVAANDAEPTPEDTATAQQFEASLRYLTADLGEIARMAPPHKQPSLHSVVNLLQAIADT